MCIMKRKVKQWGRICGGRGIKMQDHSIDLWSGQIKKYDATHVNGLSIRDVTFTYSTIEDVAFT